VTFTLYNTGACNGTVVATDSNRPLAGGIATSANFTAPNSNGTFSYLAHYNGDANYPQHDGPCEPFTVQGAPKGQIAPTQESCSTYNNGTSATLTAINYTLSNAGKISQNVNPGVFFYFTKITTTTANQTVTVSQSNTSTNNAALFQVQSANIYTSTCGTLASGTLINNGTGASFTLAAPGTYIIGIKYTTKSIAGTTAPVPADITYNFTTSLGGTTGASVLLHRS